MGKAEETRQMIVAEAASLFNQQGYNGTSMSDLMRATGLQKGGIYNHFAGKDALALAAFDYAWQLLRARYGRIFREAAGDPTKQLLGMVRHFVLTLEDPVLAGGCPILNTAVESDDTHPELRARVRAAIDEWRDAIRRIVARGQARGVFTLETDGDTLATLIIAVMEGAVMMSKLYGDPVHVHRAADFLADHISRHVVR